MLDTTMFVELHFGHILHLLVNAPHRVAVLAPVDEERRCVADDHRLLAEALLAVVPGGTTHGFLPCMPSS